MSDKGRTNDSSESKIAATGDSLAKLHINHVLVRKSFSASITKPVQHSKVIPNNRPATASSVSFSSSSQIVKHEPIENTNGLQDEVNRALEKYRSSAMSLPQAESVSERIETQLAALRERLQVNQLLLESTRKQMENVMFEEEGIDNFREDDQTTLLEIGATKLSSGIGQYQKTVNEAINVLDKVQMMNNFHDSSELKRKVHWKKEEK